MEIGLFTRWPCRQGLSHAEAFQEQFETVQATEGLGYDNVWLGEEHFSHDVGYDLYLGSSVLTLGSAIAARTTRLRIGMAVVPLPLGHPLRIAEEAAIVDLISGGRLDFGVGRSSNAQTYQRYGLPYADSRERMLEALEVIKKAWTQERFSHQGEFFTFNDVCLVPKPCQKPHPRVFLAVTSAETFAVAGRYGYDIFVNPRGELTALRQGADEYHEAWREAGHSGTGKIVARILCYVAETTRQAHAEPEEGTMALLRHQSRLTAPQPGLSEAVNRARAERSQYLANLPYEEVLKTDVTYGTPEFVTEAMLRLREETGAAAFMLDMNGYGSLPPEKSRHSMRLFSERVMPLFKYDSPPPVFQ
jgi:alkanesulfonate monooxygenase SsuD/methylene tetrahydromethanopterin reductase-like flavin-dependent oxidoreductase (luciferase family)